MNRTSSDRFLESSETLTGRGDDSGRVSDADASSYPIASMPARAFGRPKSIAPLHNQLIPYVHATGADARRLPPRTPSSEGMELAATLRADWAQLSKPISDREPLVGPNAADGREARRSARRRPESDVGAG